MNEKELKNGDQDEQPLKMAFSSSEGEVHFSLLMVLLEKGKKPFPASFGSWGPSSIQHPFPQMLQPQLIIEIVLLMMGRGDQVPSNYSLAGVAHHTNPFCFAC